MTTEQAHELEQAHARYAEAKAADAAGSTDRATALSLRANVAALRAVNTTSLANGSVRHVKSYGWFTLDTSSSAPERLPWLVTPTTGPGRWLATVSNVHELLPAMNFSPKIAAGDLSWAAYDPTYRRWYVAGASENARASSDHGQTWSGASLIAGVMAGETSHRIAVDGAGNVIVATDTRYIAELEASTGTWTKVDVGGAAVSVLPCPIVYDPIRSLWCWMGVPAAASTLIKTSSDRVTWTSRTPSAAHAAVRSLHCMTVKPSNGRIIAMLYRSSDTTLLPATSDDGGITWTDRASLASAIASPTKAWLSYNPNTNTWLYGIGETSGTPTCAIWRSADDGVTWTKILDLAATVLEKAAPLGPNWVATATDSTGIYECVASTDDGASWKRTNFMLEGTSRGIFAGREGELLAVCDAHAYPSLRMSTLGGAVT